MARAERKPESEGGSEGGHGPDRLGPSVWDRPEPGQRRAAYSRAGIAAAAMKIADAEGLDAVSMRRVARELGAGTMTLYHYVRNKDELLSLLDDAFMAEFLIPEDEMPGDWRAALSEIAFRTRDAYLRHPWMFDAPSGIEGGPNSAKHFEQSLAAVAGTGLQPIERIEIVMMVDDFVVGFCMRLNAMRRFAGGRSVDEAADQLAEMLDARLGRSATSGMPHTEAIFAGGDFRETLAEVFQTVLSDERFAAGLNLILDGIERRIEDQRSP